ncbi:uncharacterized protein LOC120089115 [Benincasa hispida]|uniref:uncharacterized protein LOC120089115 n=1 Tax=Benincasa hispida TaxID=102211 RepID=UPI001902643F|nr:uncharacterized protein LOC120089115 [Benincasa hispida]
MAQIKLQKEKKTRKSKEKACLFAVVSSTIFTPIMTLKYAYEIWNYLKSEYEGDARIKGMCVLNLIREFELERMTETKSIKEYSDRLLGIANRIKLLGSTFKDSRIVEKILVTVPENFEASISTLENTKDLTQITLAEILNALQAQEQRRAMRLEGVVVGTLQTKHENARNNKKNQNLNGESSANNKVGVKMGSKNQQRGEEAKIVDQEEEEEDQLFVATCFVGSESNKSWLIDSGYTNHMTYDKELFRDLKPTNITKVRIGNGDYISVKGKGTVAITSYTEVAQVFWKFNASVENESGCEIPIVRSENGKEYTSNKRDKLDRRASSGIFIGYSTVSKAYKIFQSQTGNIVVSRDVHFLEDEEWSWDEVKKKDQTITEQLKCNVAVCELAVYAEVKKDQMWMVSMKKEMLMIEKNKTWVLVNRPQGRKIRHNQEEIYVEQPQGFVKEDEEYKVYLLKKAL